MTTIPGLPYLTDLIWQRGLLPSFRCVAKYTRTLGEPLAYRGYTCTLACAFTEQMRTYRPILLLTYYYDYHVVATGQIIDATLTGKRA